MWMKMKEAQEEAGWLQGERLNGPPGCDVPGCTGAPSLTHRTKLCPLGLPAEPFTPASDGDHQYCIRLNPTPTALIHFVPFYGKMYARNLSEHKGERLMG